MEELALKPLAIVFSSNLDKEDGAAADDLAVGNEEEDMECCCLISFIEETNLRILMASLTGDELDCDE